MDNKIKIANRSRKNRVFFDDFIREMVICLNVGEAALNREQLFPTYVNHAQAGKLVENEYYIQITRDTGCLYQPLGQILSSKLLDQIDEMLQKAPRNLKGSHSRKLITDYLSSCTDLTDCHYSALNLMQSVF